MKDYLPKFLLTTVVIALAHGALSCEKQDPRCGKCKVSGTWSAKKL